MLATLSELTGAVGTSDRVVLPVSVRLKLMDSARQVIRWSIPGSLLFVSSTMVFVLIGMGLGESLHTAIAPIEDNLSPAAGIALAIPLGFCVYQGYYWGYGPLRWFGFVSANRGIAMLARLTSQQRDVLAPLLEEQLENPARAIDRTSREGLPARTLDKLRHPYWSPATRNTARGPLRRTKWLELDRGPADDPYWTTAEQRATVRLIYQRRWWVHYQTASTLLDVAELGSGDGLKREWIAVSDIYHSIGATRTAIVTGLLLGLAAAVGDGAAGPPRTTTQIMTAVAVGVALVLACGFCVQVLNRVRRNAYFSSTQRAGFGLRAALALDPKIAEALATGALGDAATRQGRLGQICWRRPERSSPG